MDDEPDQIETSSWKSLKRLPDSTLRHPDREDTGGAYSPILLDLQIRPEDHTTFFEANIRPFRNKKEISVLLAKGDKDSLLKASKAYVTAYGSLVWGKERQWLLKPDELAADEEVLQYIPPRARKVGDHDRFYHVLDGLWTKMRNIIFELKPQLQQSNTVGGGQIESRITRSRRDRQTSLSSSVSASTVPTARDDNSSRPTQSPEPHMVAQVGAAYRRLARVPEQFVNANAFANQATACEKYWPSSKTEEVILNASTDLKLAQKESHPEVFATLWHRHLARLGEIEQYEEQEARLAVAIRDDDNMAEQENINPPGFNGSIDDSDANDSNMTTAAVDPSMQEKDVTMTNTKYSDLPTPDPTPTTSSFPIEIISTDHAANFEPTTSYSDEHRSNNLPSFAASAYIPATIPNRMAVYITPYDHNANHSVQPYIWSDAPVHETSYVAFRNGIRLRANVPDSVLDEKMQLVLGYGWNDFCRVITSERSWREGFIEDIRIAAKKRRVGVWRMRVCVVVGGGSGNARA